MSKINILDRQVYNRISAGEVVESPFSVVKELVENAIDARANKIEVEVSGGGRVLVRVLDSGTGIEKQELKNAILPHATSKIKDVSDLDDIKSLGFRGEALASISAVSKLTIISRTKDEETGAKLYAEGGLIENISDCASTVGTQITVENLFYNTPAREKFLKTDRAEEGEITATVARFILSNPNVAFKYILNGKVVYQSFGDGLESAFVCVYGAKTIKDCFFIDSEINGVCVKGYIGKHYYVKPNRSYMTVFLNGRYVVNQTVSTSIINAYSAYVMKRQYPFTVISITMPSSEVDVNVHPNKLNVRFSNNQVVYSSIYHIISKVLDGSSEALNIVIDDVKTEKTVNNTEKKLEKPLEYTREKYKFDSLVFSDVAPSIKFNDNVEIKKPVVDIFAENKAFLEKLESEKQNKALFNVVQDEIKIDRELKYIGQALDTFLIFDDGKDVYFIDQHAAHERINYDRFMGEVETNNIAVQSMIVPFVLDLNNVEYDFILSKVDLLKSMGIEIEPFGNLSFKVSALPVCISNMDLTKFFDGLLSDLNSIKSISLPNLLKEKIAQKACKASVKSGDKLSEGDVRIIMEKIKGDLGLKCPHGRPIAVKITRTEIDKWFKRIV